MEHSDDIDVHALLASRRQVAVIWGVEDVADVRPDLDEAERWEVLQRAFERHDANDGITWDTLAEAAESLYGAAPDDDDDCGGDDA